MTAPKLIFERTEYDARLAKTRKAMDERGIEVLIVSDPSNMNWLTGYDGWSFYVHQCVVVTGDGAPIWFGRGQDANGAIRTVYMSDDNIIGYPDHYVQSVDRHPMDYLAAQLAARGYAKAHIGVEMDNYYFSAKAFASLQTGLPDGRFLDATALVNWQRSVKSAAEIALMRAAGKLTEKIHARILDKVAVGLRKSDLVAEIYDAGLRYDGRIGIGGDYPAIVPLLPSGADAAAPHLTWDDQPMQAGQGTFFEVSGVTHRYHCPQSRTVFLGKPPQAFLEAEKAVVEGLEAGIAMARPGNTAEQIAGAFFGVLKKYGITKDNRTGYPIGLSYPPDWGERTWSLRPDDGTVMEENMTFHFMTGLWMADWGFEISESVRIGSGAAETLSNVPRKLFVKD